MNTTMLYLQAAQGNFPSIEAPAKSLKITDKIILLTSKTPESIRAISAKHGADVEVWLSCGKKVTYHPNQSVLIESK